MESRKDKNILVLVLDDKAIYNKNFDRLLLYFSLQYQKDYEKDHPENLYIKLLDIVKELKSLVMDDESKTLVQLKIPSCKKLKHEILDSSHSKEIIATLTEENKALIINSITNSFLNYLFSLTERGIALYKLILFLANQPFFEEIIKQVDKRKIDKIILQHGSNRLSYKLESEHSKKNATGFFAIDLQYICDSLNSLIKKQGFICEFDPFMPSDIFNNLEIGESYRRIIQDYKNNPAESHEKKSLDSIFDSKKFLSLYMILHYYANEITHGNIIVFFWENQKKIRNFLIEKFENGYLIYKKMKFVIYPYDGILIKSGVKEISGKGEVDLQYPKSIKAIRSNIGAEDKESGSVSSKDFEKEIFLLLHVRQTNYYAIKQRFFNPPTKTRPKSKSSSAILSDKQQPRELMKLK